MFLIVVTNKVPLRLDNNLNKNLKFHLKLLKDKQKIFIMFIIRIMVFQKVINPYILETEGFSNYMVNYTYG